MSLSHRRNSHREISRIYREDDGSQCGRLNGLLGASKQATKRCLAEQEVRRRKWQPSPLIPRGKGILSDVLYSSICGQCEQELLPGTSELCRILSMNGSR